MLSAAQLLRPVKFHPGRLNPAAWYSADSGCQRDGACQFTSADKEYLTMTTPYNPTTSDFTVAGWVLLDSLTNNRTLISTGGTGDGVDGFTLEVNSSGNVFLGFSDSVQATRVTGTFTTGMTTATWYHLAVTFNRDGVATLYLNGVADDVTVDISGHQGSLGYTTGGYLGASAAGANLMNGKLDEWKAWNKVISAAELAYDAAGRMYSDFSAVGAPATINTGLVFYHGLAEMTGQRRDSHGTNHLSQTFGEKVTNGTFTGADTGWTAGANWAYGTNNEAATAATADLSQSTTAAVVGKLYTKSFSAVVTTGTVACNFGGVTGTTRSTTATFTENLRATAVTALAIHPVAEFTGTVDDVSVKADEILGTQGIARSASTDVNFAAQLNGTSQSFSATTAAFNAATSDFARFLAFYCDRLPTGTDKATLMAAGTPGAGNQYLWLYILADGSIVKEFNDGTGAALTMTLCPAASVVVGNWYTLVVNCERAANATAYLNGVAQTGVAISSRAGTLSPGNVTIGKATAASSYFAGRIDNPGYANRLITVAEVAWLNNNVKWRQWSELGVAGTDGSGLIASVVKGFFEFDALVAGSTTAVAGTDATGNGANLTANGAPTRGQGINYAVGQVTLWTDRSPNAVNATQITPAKVPWWESLVTGANSRPGVGFDGVDDDFAFASTSLAAGFAFSCPFKCAVTPSSHTIIGGDSDNCIRILDNTTIRVKVNGTTVDFAVAAIGTTAHILTVTRNASYSVSVYLDGVASAAQSRTGTIVLSRLGSSTTAGFMSGYLFELLLYARALSDSQRRKVERYLAGKYGVTVV